MPELRADGLYGNLGCDDEKQRAFLSVLSAVWLVNGDYTSMVECQKPGARLRMQTFNLIRENLCIREMTTSQITATGCLECVFLYVSLLLYYFKICLKCYCTLYLEQVSPVIQILRCSEMFRHVFCPVNQPPGSNLDFGHPWFEQN